MGKLLGEARAEVELSAAIFEYYAKNAEAQLAPEKLPVADPAEGEAVLVCDPLGVLLAVEPWNFPITRSPGSSRPSFRRATPSCSSTPPTCPSARRSSKS
jgi:acyl-CoA reductase-like NAD-dependent aldehyde dehydrogenase